jgi:patatin-like phospholipase/acyl hydrolase
MLLAEIERRTGVATARLFDVVAGTSTGGILALALTKPRAVDGQPEYGADDLVAMYEREGSRIFERPLWHRVVAVENLLEERFPATGLEQVLDEYFGDARLRDALTEVVVTSYELETRQPWFFARHKALRDPDYDFPLRYVARATSAAPTYFEPAELTATQPVGGLVDGGVFANNPAMCGYVEARKLHPEADDFLVVSLGTGQHTRPIHYAEASRWGIALWAKPILNVVFDGVSDTVDHQMHVLCREGDDARPRYYRFQTALDRGSDDMDDSSRTNLAALRSKAEEIIAERDAELDVLCEQLRERAMAPA